MHIINSKIEQICTDGKSNKSISEILKGIPQNVFLGDFIVDKKILHHYLNHLLYDLGTSSHTNDSTIIKIEEQVLACNFSDYDFSDEEKSIMFEILSHKAIRLSNQIISDTWIDQNNTVRIRNVASSNDYTILKRYLRRTLEVSRNYNDQYSPFREQYGFSSEARDRICCLLLRYYDLYTQGGTLDYKVDPRFDQYLYWDFENWTVDSANYIPKDKMGVYCLLRYQSWQRFGRYLAHNPEKSHQIQYRLK